MNNRNTFIIIISVLLPLIVAFLFFKPVKLGIDNDWVYKLPHLNALINSSTSFVLILGLIFIKNGKVKFHKTSMLSALALGIVFLVSYVIYHSSADSTSYGGDGVFKKVYYALLIGHVLTAIIAVPFVLMALKFALSDQVEKHKRIVKYAYPIWLFVSISGVLVYFMIRPYY